ncbi:MAG: chloride channel protein [Verrucomicrobia bacterium]|nr:chloride channel protein [Verrucomicrobiota bacterium]
MKNFIDYFRAIPIDLQPYLRPFLYGLIGGSAAVAFQLGIKLLEWSLWTQPSQNTGKYFVLISLAVISTTSLLAGLILTYVSREAAGSGIPQLKVAFWRDFGYLPFKVAVAKFFAGIITIGGGCSLGREGPTVHIAGALASNMAGMFGVAKQGRRAALLSGAAAGLAAAFNTPLSAITFVMEEIVEDLNNTIFLAQTLVASVTATFVTHVFIGRDPAFVIPPVSQLSWTLTLLVIPTAALAALAGVAFQKGTLIWRDRIKKLGRIPPYLKPVIGALINWALGISVFFWIARLGVFGLGYQDLESILRGQVSAMQALILLVAKLAATTAVYAWGGAGGIFSPTLFFGAAAGLLISTVCTPIAHLSPSDQLALAVAGMSACLGAVVRAPITSILIVFEMTHQFAFVPLLMIGAIASQAVSRLFCPSNFYSDVIERDGIELDRHIPPRSLATLHHRPISTLANFSPVFACSTNGQELEQLCAAYPYQQFPLVIDGRLVGMLDRNAVLKGPNIEQAKRPAETVNPDATIRDSVTKMINKSVSLLVVLSPVDETPIGIVTLHDILRLQSQLAEAL